MELSDIFLAARDSLREVGWTTETMQAEDGRVCLRGSLLAALNAMDAMRGDYPTLDNAVFRLNDYCMDEYGVGTIQLNDDYLTSEEEAAEILEGAAKWAANGD